MIKKFIYSVTILYSMVLLGADYYVSPQGKDSNSGSLAKPFMTVAKAAESMKPGDSCYLRGGRYREVVEMSGLNGNSEKPLIFRVYKDEKVVFDGTRKLDLHWKKWKGNIYKAKIDFPVWQLFVDDKLVQVARWPNASFEDGSIWSMDASMRYTDKMDKGGKTAEGIIYDKTPVNHIATDTDDEGSSNTKTHTMLNKKTLAETGIDFTGCLAVMNLRHWITYTRPVTKHKAGQEWFEYDKSGTVQLKYLVYYMLGLPCLDRENEWWYDKGSGTVYLYAPGGVSPKSLNISGKVRDFNLIVRDSSHLTFGGIKFMGTTFCIVNSESVTIENCHLRYPATNKFMLGCLKHVGRNPGRTLNDVNNGYKKGDSLNNVTTYISNRRDGVYKNTVRNCIIEYANAPAMYINSPGSVVENCYIHDIEWDVNSDGGSGTLPCGKNTTIRRNTVHTSGNSEGIRPGARSTVELNNCYNLGLLQHDGSAINIGTHAQVGTLVTHNWVHDTTRKGIRFDSTTNAAGGHGSVCYNVMFGLADALCTNKIKGDNHLTYGNTGYNATYEVSGSFGTVTGMNKASVTRNNIIDFLSAHVRRGKPVPGVADHNTTGEGSCSLNLRDPKNQDFRPCKKSELVNAGKVMRKSDLPSDKVAFRFEDQTERPDIGAYEFGDKNYWIPGHKSDRASMPVPPLRSITVKTDADLMWLPGLDAKYHKVYFGTEPKKLKLVSTQKNNIYTPKRLRAGERYYWRVDEVTDSIKVKGKTWSFKCKD